MVYRGILVGAAALGLTTLAGGALAQQTTWPSYAPRCATPELAMSQGMRDPCEQQLAIFGPRGPMVMSRNGMDVEATGSIADKAGRRDQGGRL